MFFRKSEDDDDDDDLSEKLDTDDHDEKKKKKRHPIRHTVICLFIGFILGEALCIIKPWNLTWASRNENNTDLIDVTTTESTDDKTEEDVKTTVTTEQLQSIVKEASDLTTLKYYYKDACSQVSAKEFDKLNIQLPFTTSKVVFTYKGCIKLGVDLSQVLYDIDNENKMITITLPDVEVTGNEIYEDSFVVVDEEESVFNPQNLDDYASLIAGLKEDKQKEVMADSNIIDEVESETKEVIKDFITSAPEAADYTVEFE